MSAESGEVLQDALGKITDILSAAEGVIDYDPRFTEDVGNDGLFKYVYRDANNDYYGSEGGKKQIHVLPTPAWVPESYIRSQKKNFYLSMFNPQAVFGTGNGTPLEFYKEESSSFPMGMLKNIGKSALTLVANQVGAMANTAQGVVNSVKGLLGIEDDEPPANDPFLENQPYVNVYGINMSPDLKTHIEIIKQAFNLIKDIMNTDSGLGDLVDRLGKGVMNAIKAILKNQPGAASINDFSSLWAHISKNENREHSILELMLTKSFIGSYLQFVKIPYQHPAVSFQSCKGQWSGGFGDSSDFINKFVGSAYVMGSVEKISWSPQNLTMQTPITIDFNMYNDTFEHLATNFYFMLGFLAGSKATTDMIFMRSPYLYDIEVPGGGRYRLCTCDCTFKPVGRMRRLGYSMAYELAKFSPWGGAWTLKELGESCSPHNGFYFPDAWSVNIQFKSVLPDTWNFLSTYYFNKARKDPKLGDTITNILGEAVKGFAEAAGGK